MLKSEQHMLFGPGVLTPDGWDIILILYIADADGRRLTVADVIQASGDSPESGKRRIAYLSHAGIVVGDGSSEGDINDVITLAPEAVTKVEDLIERVWVTIGTV